METTLRYFGYGHYIYQNSLSVVGYFWIADKRFGFSNRLDGRYIHTKISGSPLVTTDNLGHRTTFIGELNIDEPYIIFLGDSTTFCAEVSDYETGPSEVAKLLKANKMPFNVINTGVRGFNTLQCKRKLEDTLGIFKRSLIAIYVYCENDLVENLNPIVYFPVKAPTMWIDKKSGKKIEVEVESQIVSWGQAFDSDPFTTKKYLSKYLSYCKSVLLYQSYRLFMNLYSRLNSNDKAKVILEAGSVGPINGGTPEWEKQVTWAKKNGAEAVLVHLLSEMNKICETNGIKFITTKFTTDNEIYADDYYKNICQKVGVNFASIANKFSKESTYYMAKLASSPGYDPHYNQNGTRAFAEGILPIIKSTINSN